MFHSIRAALAQRQENLQLQSSVSVVVRQAVLTYLQENYPGAVATVTTQYRAEEKLLVISTPSKALAGELVLNTGEIRSYLVQRNINVNRIVIR